MGRRGTVRFTNSEERLPGSSTSTLSETLQVLRDVGLVDRDVFPDTPPRVEYRLTEAGTLLGPRFRELLARVREEAE